MADCKEQNQQTNECTHDCHTCGCGCSEHNPTGESKLEKTLYAVSDMDADALLKALQEFTE